MVCSMIWFLLSKYVLTTEIYCQLTDVMVIAYRESSTSQNDANNSTTVKQKSTMIRLVNLIPSGTDVNARGTVQLILANCAVTIWELSIASKLCIRTVQQCPWRKGIPQSVHATYKDVWCNSTNISVLSLLFKILSSLDNMQMSAWNPQWQVTRYGVHHLIPTYQYI